jgi:transposase
MARFRRTTSKDNTYLQYVHSYRNHKGQPATKVLANLGNISNMPEEQIERLTKSFIKALGVEDKFQMNSFKAGKGYHYGRCLPVIAIWHQLGLDDIITSAIPAKVKIAVARISLIQTANRFSDPASKLACYRWYALSLFSQLKNFIHFPEDEEEKLHTYYRSLDYLWVAKDKIEKGLYYRLKSYGMDNRLVLYDITSVYFEGNDSEIGKNGYSRDHRPDADQIVLGLVMNRDGIPIAHHVFEGNRVDKSTVEEIIDDLEKRFSIKEIVFVGDRGMLTVENIKYVKGRGNNNYILGIQKRNRRIIKYIMTKIDKTATVQQFGYSDLSEKFKGEYSKGVRFICCYNPEIARLNQKTREERIETFEELVNNTKIEGLLEKIQNSHHKLRSYLSRYHLSNFYKLRIEKVENSAARDKESEENIYKLHIAKQEDALSAEADLDGRYFIQTEVDSSQLTMEEVVSSYKSLQKVERAFRIIKDDLDIRPIYVRRETRIRGHVMICYFALLIDILLEKRLREIFPDMEDTPHRRTVLKNSRCSDNDPLTMKTLMEELDTVRLVPLYLNEKKNPTYISTKIENNIKKLFYSLGIKNVMDPQRLRIIVDQKNKDKNQLELNFGS